MPPPQDEFDDDTKSLDIPESMRATLLPSNNLSIINLVSNFSLPEPELDANFSLEFSSDLPVTETWELADHLCHLSVPPKSIISDHFSNAKQHWRDGAKSIHHPHSSTPLPFWVLTYWSEIHKTISPVQSAWRNASKWLVDIPGHLEDVNLTVEMLNHIPWTAAVPCRTLELPLSTLLPFLSRDWLASEQIDLMIESLETEISQHIPEHDILLLDSFLSNTITSLYIQHRDAGDDSYNKDGSSWIARFGRKLQPTSELGAVFNIHDDHWVAVVLDLRSMTMSYGDSAGEDPNAEALFALLWFVKEHLPETPIVEATRALYNLPTAKQVLSRNWWQCGLYSVNALAHHFLPERRPIVSDDLVDGDLHRLEELRAILQRVEKVSPP